MILTRQRLEEVIGCTVLPGRIMHYFSDDGLDVDTAKLRHRPYMFYNVVLDHDELCDPARCENRIYWLLRVLDRSQIMSVMHTWLDSIAKLAGVAEHEAVLTTINILEHHEELVVDANVELLGISIIGDYETICDDPVAKNVFYACANMLYAVHEHLYPSDIGAYEYLRTAATKIPLIAWMTSGYGQTAQATRVAEQIQIVNMLDLLNPEVCHAG